MFRSGSEHVENPAIHQGSIRFTTIQYDVPQCGRAPIFPRFMAMCIRCSTMSGVVYTFLYVLNTFLYVLDMFFKLRDELWKNKTCLIFRDLFGGKARYSVELADRPISWRYQYDVPGVQVRFMMDHHGFMNHHEPHWTLTMCEQWLRKW